MTPQEIAMKLASASATCEKCKCPFASKCKGDYASCVMKEVAMVLRAYQAEVDTLNATVIGLRDILLAVQEYTSDVEKTNKRYHDLIVAFGHGYRPKNPHKIRRVRKPRKKPEDPVEMDGDERYAYEPQKTTEPPPPLVII